MRAIPVPPVLVCLLRQHLRECGTAPDGRLLGYGPGERGDHGLLLSFGPHAEQVPHA